MKTSSMFDTSKFRKIRNKWLKLCEKYENGMAFSHFGKSLILIGRVSDCSIPSTGIVTKRGKIDLLYEYFDFRLRPSLSLKFGSKNGLIRFNQKPDFTISDFLLIDSINNNSAIDNTIDYLYFDTIRPGSDSIVISAQWESQYYKLEIPFVVVSQDRDETISSNIETLNQEFFRYARKNPELLYKLSPREFESIIAEILRDMGCYVELTPETRDGGRDIFAVFDSPFGKLLTIVECKKYSPNRKIGIDIIERFLWVIDSKDKASCGLIVTTSFFSKDAKMLGNEFKYRLKLKDFEGLKEWINNYGNWAEGESGIWYPN